MAEEMMPETRLRASDADRDAIAERLREALVEGRLTDEEHGERLAQLYAARTYGDLDRVTADLPLPDIAPVPYRQNRPAAPSENVPPQVAVFSGSTVRPSGPVHGTTAGVAMFGGARIDLRNAVIDEGGVTVNAFALFGSVEVVVPIDAAVKVLGVPLFGSVNHEKDDLAADGPLVDIRAVALFGGVTIKRRPPKQPKRRNEKAEG